MKNTINTLNGSTKKWKEKLIKYADSKIKLSEHARCFYEERNLQIENPGVHLAVFSEPFLSMLLEGEKTVESRFSLNRVPPFQRVEEGDIVFVKRSGGEVVAYFIINKIEYHHSITVSQLKNLKTLYSKAIGATSVENFWEDRCEAKYISLFQIAYVDKISPFRISKRDRRAWSVLRSVTNNNQNELWER